MKSTRLWMGVLLIFAVLITPFIMPIQHNLSIPNQLNTFITPQNVAAASVKTGDNSKYAMNSTVFNSGEAAQLVDEAAGLPVKKVDSSKLENLKIIPGGHSIGVQLHTLGVLVVGHHQVKNKEQMVSPGEIADVEVGDVILKINGKKINNMKEVKPFIEKAGKENEKLDLTIKRGNKQINTTLDPVKDTKENEYRIGLYIRDSTAGIGTMTFYDPKSKKYGALGHVISDMDTRKRIEIHDGTIVRSNVTSIEKGNNGKPGEKLAKFSAESKKLGNITKNSPFGIFGKLNNSVPDGKYNKPMPIALSHQVKEGPAKILTVVDGEKVEKFDVEIVSSVPQKFPSTKGMVVKITDPELLDKTGGIVQGMSGSPIIQDGKLIGAVTHVFVNDPTSGYGVHIEWMLQEAGIDIYKKEQAG